MDEQTDLHRMPYSEPLLREHGSLRDLTGKSGEKLSDKVTDKTKEKEKEKDGDKDALKDILDKTQKDALEKGLF
jgi:hypothetical protein